MTGPVPRFDAGYVILGKGERAGETTGIEIYDAPVLAGMAPYRMYQTWVVWGTEAFFTGTLHKTFVERFDATPPDGTLKYRNWTYRRLTEAEVDALNVRRIKNGGLLLR